MLHRVNGIVGIYIDFNVCKKGGIMYMTTKIIYNLLLLPGVKYYFKKELFYGNDPEIETDEELLFLLQKEEKRKEDLHAEDFYPIGLVGKFSGETEDGNVEIKILQRVKIENLYHEDNGWNAEWTACMEKNDFSKDKRLILYKEVQDKFLIFMRNFQWDFRTASYLMGINNLPEFICAIVPYLNLSWKDKYAVIQEDSLKARYLRMKDIIFEVIALYEVGEEAENKQKVTEETAYKEIALKKQIEFLQDQLDEMHPENITDVRRFEKKIQESGMQDEARQEVEKVLHRMKQEGKDGHEYGMLYEYLDFVTSLSWEKAPYQNIDLSYAEKVLNENHYGLQKVKKRIIEQLAVMALKKQQSGSILLFVGPPGTGKTSIGQSIAKALGREYVRISLGGVRDEAEIRGHRRTYVGAMPGRMMEAIKRSGTNNPVIVLDEVDKLVKEYGGDPASALLEVLDPEQNASFTDHYLNIPYDLSNVLFVCTANNMDTIPEPLLNRMEVIPFSGYTPIEKMQIARKHLLPKAMKRMGIASSKLKVTDEALQQLIAGYTAESGVRNLKRQLESLCRHVAVKLVKGEQKSFTVNEKKLQEYMDKKPTLHEKIGKDTKPGIVTGLAWTQAGGEILFIETALTKGSGKVQITGQLGEVMQESAKIAISLVKLLHPEFVDMLKDHDLHIHVPEGAVPKDGPSAGITLVTALTSLVTDRAVDPTIGMTGEVSLRGYVMPIGGLPEKLMAAQRAGVKQVFIPKENEKDLEDVADEIKEQLKIKTVEKIEEVIQQIF